MNYTKPPFSLDEQVKLLETRGMSIPDHERAKSYLAHINYYRFGGYWLPFEHNHTSHTFRDKTSFDDVLNLYVFDRELRLLLLDAIERVEVSVRTNWAYHLAHNHGSHAHLDSKLFYKPFWVDNIKNLEDAVSSSREVFIEHYRTKYTNPALPPVWAVCEIMSLGTLSRWYKSLIPRPTKRLISRCYDLDEAVLESFLQHLTCLRNLCAHHSRVWNRQITVTMKLPRSKPNRLISSFNPSEPRRLYNTLVMLAWLLDRVSPHHTWKSRLLALLDENNIDVTSMGFPANFRQCGIWNNGV